MTPEVIGTVVVDDGGGDDPREDATTGHVDGQAQGVGDEPGAHVAEWVAGGGHKGEARVGGPVVDEQQQLKKRGGRRL